MTKIDTGSKLRWQWSPFWNSH